MALCVATSYYEHFASSYDFFTKRCVYCILYYFAQRYQNSEYNQKIPQSQTADKPVAS